MFGKTLALLALTTLAEASGGCPAIWSTIASDLSKSFIGFNGCTDLARGAIRFAFHDSGSYSSKTPAYAPATGGADGSLLLSSVEISREENAGLQQYYAFLRGKYDQYQSQVGAADLIQFAASVAIVSCPGGPKVQTVVGRKDTSTPAPDNLLPKAFGPGAAQQVLIQLFEDKGISQPELAALIGAHTASKAVAQEQYGVPFDGPQDSTPSQWDVTYYSETDSHPKGVYSFESDINLSNPNATVGQVFQSFVNSQSKWNAAFAPAMAHLSVLGISESDQANFIDCTSAVPSGSNARLIRAAPINDRIRESKRKQRPKHTAAGIPTWSPTVVLICRSTAYVWQSGRDAQFSADCGRMCLNIILQTICTLDTTTTSSHHAIRACHKLALWYRQEETALLPA
ncbi:heme peroxidase, partial [Aureobasidium melanogenum]